MKLCLLSEKIIIIIKGILQRVSMCAVKTDLCIEDVLVVSETGEGQFTTLNVRGEKCDSQSSSVFTITSPFSGSLYCCRMKLFTTT